MEGVISNGGRGDSVQITASPAILAVINGEMGPATLPRLLYLTPQLC